MAISWTLVVLGAFLQGMQCNVDNGSTATPKLTTRSISDAPTADSTKTTTSFISLSSTGTTLLSSLLTSATQSNKAVTTSVTLESSTPTTTLITSVSTKPSSPSSSTDSNKPTAQPINGSTLLVQTEPTLSVTNATTLQNGPFTTHVTTNKPETQNTGTTLTDFNNSTQKSSTTDAATDLKQFTTDLDTSATTTSTEAGTTQLLSTQTKPSPSNLTENSTSPITEAPDSKSTASQILGTTNAQTTASTIGQDIINSTPTPQTIFNYSFDLSSSSTEKHIVSEACKTLGQTMKGNCTAFMKIQDKKLTVTVTIDADQKISIENYKPLETDRGDAKNGTEDKNMGTTHGTLTKNGTEGENKVTIPDTLIAIMASCGALVLILCCFAAYCTYHRRSYRKNQQHLTEELQTVENGYHDNPTLEVMEVQPEMQEKKLTMNGEFNDSWIVPIDNLLKEDIPDEEDTHL